MTGLLQGKSTLVSGAARGIGRATALLFAEEGARVVVADLDIEGAGQTVAQIRDAGGEAEAVQVDTSNAEQVKAMVATAVDSFGRLDCAFNNAGIAPPHVEAFGAKTADWSEQSFDRMIEVNLKGVWLAMREQLWVMQEQASGAIVNTASIAGLVGLPMGNAYVAAKHGVVGLTRTAAIDYAKQNIRVNAVCPGYIDTDMTKAAMASRGAEILTTTPMGRQGEADEIAQMVCWLCSDRASYVTGAAYNVDGGYVAG